MNRFLVLYHSSTPATERMAESTAEQTKANVQAWMDWAARNQSALVDLGAPLGASLSLGSASSGLVGGYSILQGESIDDIAARLEGHPHLAMEGSRVEVLAMTSIPGMEAAADADRDVDGGDENDEETDLEEDLDEGTPTDDEGGDEDEDEHANEASDEEAEDHENAADDEANDDRADDGEDAADDDANDDDANDDDASDDDANDDGDGVENVEEQADDGEADDVGDTADEDPVGDDQPGDGEPVVGATAVDDRVSAEG